MITLEFGSPLYSTLMLSVSHQFTCKNIMGDSVEGVEGVTAVKV